MSTQPVFCPASVSIATKAAQLERIEHRYEIEPAVCVLGHALKRMGEEISEQLDCVPAQFFVHRHIRGKYAYACCQPYWQRSCLHRSSTKASRGRA